MEGFVATKLDEFDRGKISRRHLIETLTLAATTVYATGGAKAEGSALKVALINHISYSCPNFRQAGDWYSKVFNLDQVGLKDTEVTLPFGKMGELPYNVTAKDVPVTFIIARSIDRPQNPRVKFLDHRRHHGPHLGRILQSARSHAIARDVDRRGGKRCGRSRPSALLLWRQPTCRAVDGGTFAAAVPRAHNCRPSLASFPSTDG